MRQWVTMKQMEKDVIKLFIYTIFIFLNLWLPQKARAQRLLEVNNEQYLVITSVFKYSPEKTIKISRKTIPFESWMNFFQEGEFKNLEVIGYCTLQDIEFKQAVDEFRNLMPNLGVKKINQDKLIEKFHVVKNSKNSQVTSISEPKVLGNYSFQFLISGTTRVLNVQKKNKAGLWEYACGLFFPSDLQ